MNRIDLHRICSFLCLVSLAVITRADETRNQLPKKQHRTSEAPFLKPAEAVAKMAIPDGFAVNVFASEPDIGEPIAFCFDDRGRMWVVENFNYRTRREHTDDKVTRIQILEDTDSDGVFDKKKTFTDQLTFTSGIALGYGGVYVGSPPNLSFIPDADGDDVPDGPPEVLLDGWGINDRHETLNSFIWGPDGWLYGCHGVFTQSRVGKPGDDESKRQFIDGGIWRYHPVRKKYEVFARGLSNPWGFDFDDHGQGFATCCVIPHLFHVVQGGVYHKQSLPHVNPYIYDDIKTIRDHTHLSAHGGARVYLADAFPKEYRNRLFMCNIHEHAVLTDILEPNGSSFIGKHGDDFMPTNDLAWVGFSVELGPEGGVYILDWHDTDVCGNAINFPNSGRIYRIMPKGAKPIERPNLRSLSDAELVALQMESNDWFVRQARVQLMSRHASGQGRDASGNVAEFDRDGVHNALKEQLRTAGASNKRLRAMWALYSTDGLSTSELESLLLDSDPHIRAWSIQMLCDASDINAFQVAETATGHVPSSNVLARFREMAKSDSSPIVRLYLAAALQRLPFQERWPILQELAMHGEDAGDNNLPRMYWFALEPMVPKYPKASLELAVKGNIPKLQEFVARRMVSGDVAVSSNPRDRNQPRPQWQWTIQKVAPGFRVHQVGEGGVVHHTSFRNRVAVQTHPKDRKNPSFLQRKLSVPSGKTTKLELTTSHHPHGDWQLKVLVNGKVIADKLVGPQSVTKEWFDLSVDLTPYAGKEIDLRIENRANNWANEWAYWHKVDVVSQ